MRPVLLAGVGRPTCARGLTGGGATLLQAPRRPAVASYRHAEHDNTMKA
jgi:hypothetical protein